MSSASARVAATHIATSLADMAHLAGGEHRLLGDLETRQRRHRADRLDIGQVVRGEDNVAITLRNMDAFDARMRQRAAHEGNILQSGQSDVGDELSAPAQEAVVLLAGHPGADALTGCPPRLKQTQTRVRRLTSPLAVLGRGPGGYAATACGRIGATAS